HLDPVVEQELLRDDGEVGVLEVAVERLPAVVLPGEVPRVLYGRDDAAPVVRVGAGGAGDGAGVELDDAAVELRDLLADQPGDGVRYPAVLDGGDDLERERHG